LLCRIRDVFANRALRARASDGNGVSITFLGERFTITSGKEQILDLLVSSFEELVRTNEALRASEAERAKLYERERAARMAAEGANRAKSEFLTAMSHDLRTPLNAIGGYSELLSEGVQGPVNDAQQAYLDRIKRNQQHLLTLVNDVLSFARVERGNVSVTITEVPVLELFASARAVIEPQVMEKGIAYEAVPCDDVRVCADRERTEQVLVNLLANAVKFTPSGGRITLSCALSDETVAIQVRDTGIGIPPDRIDSIFDPFVQVDSRRTTEQQGVGLGLAISRNLAELMGGTLTVESTVGAGSTFSLQLRRLK
jgi:signal transduction histidine kinase